jgi:hypothetical protein
MPPAERWAKKIKMMYLRVLAFIRRVFVVCPGRPNSLIVLNTV